MLASLLARFHLISEPTPSPPDQVTPNTRDETHTPSSSSFNNHNIPITPDQASCGPMEGIKQEEQEVETRDSSTFPLSLVEHHTSLEGVTKHFLARESLPVGGGGGMVVEPCANEPAELSPEFSLAHRGHSTEEGKGLEHGYEKVENEVIAEFG